MIYAPERPDASQSASAALSTFAVPVAISFQAEGETPGPDQDVGAGLRQGEAFPGESIQGIGPGQPARRGEGAESPGEGVPAHRPRAGSVKVALPHRPRWETTGRFQRREVSLMRIGETTTPKS